MALGAHIFPREKVNDNAWTPSTNRWNADGTGYTILPTPIGGTPFPDRASRAETDSLAAFGQATWTPAALGDVFHLTAGGRYTHDKKNGSLDKVNGADTNFRLDASWNRFDPMVNVMVDVTPQVHAYGKWSTGYKAGGANARSLIFRTYDPESVATFEAGAKTEFFDRHARLNVAAFTTAYKDMQVDFLAPVTPGSSRSTYETMNAKGKGRIKGVEADLTVTPAQGLTLSASYAYVQTDLPLVANPFKANALETVNPVYTPKHAASGAIDYVTGLGDASLSFHADANYAGRQTTVTTTKSDESFVVNGRVAISDIRLSQNSPELELALWARNLLNKSYAFVKADYGAPINTIGIFNDPRTFGVQASLKF